MKDRLFRLGTLLASGTIPGLVLLLLWQVASRAVDVSPALLVLNPTDAGRGGGLASVLVSTLGVLVIAVMVAVPIGTAVAVWLSEYAGARARFVRGSLDVLASVPSIVHGLFGLTLFCEVLGLGWSLTAGGLTVAVMVLPLFARLTDESLQAAPDDWRRSGAALGVDRWRMLPMLICGALPGMVAALVLSVGRVLAESAALLFTAGTALRMPAGVGDPGRVLALHVYTLAVDVPGGQGRAATAALVLFAVVAFTTAMARLAPAWVARRWG